MMSLKNVANVTAARVMDMGSISNMSTFKGNIAKQAEQQRGMSRSKVAMGKYTVREVK
jgi:hypothetical protein